MPIFSPKYFLCRGIKLFEIANKNKTKKKQKHTTALPVFNNAGLDFSPYEVKWLHLVEVFGMCPFFKEQKPLIGTALFFRLDIKPAL